MRTAAWGACAGESGGAVEASLCEGFPFQGNFSVHSLRQMNTPLYPNATGAHGIETIVWYGAWNNTNGWAKAMADTLPAGNFFLFVIPGPFPLQRMAPECTVTSCTAGWSIIGEADHNLITPKEIMRTTATKIAEINKRSTAPLASTLQPWEPPTIS